VNLLDGLGTGDLAAADPFVAPQINDILKKETGYKIK
jgi:hypothetical protein